MPSFAAGSRCKDKIACVALIASVAECWCQVGYPSAPTGAGKVCSVGQFCNTA